MAAHDPSMAAADPSRSAWVAANAGSGKTYTLANRVTRLLLAGARPERILCLTYTKAAAAEMQGRLFDLLGKLSMLPDAELGARLDALGSNARDRESLAQARRLFAQALETPGGLKIQTIHAFCQNVLSRFPLEAGIPAGFRVLDEKTARDLMADARARVFERAGGGELALHGALTHLATHLGERRLNDFLDIALGSDRRKLERFFQTLDGNDLSQVIRNAHGVRPGESIDQAMEEFCSAARGHPIRQLVEWLAGGSETDRRRANLLLQGLETAAPREAYGHYRRVFLNQDGAPRRAALASVALKKLSPGMLDALEILAGQFHAAEERRRTAHAAELTQSLLTVADAVRVQYSAAKRARGVLDYDDLIAETRKLLDQADAAAWVLFKLDGGLDHVLVDEAQDTSPEQWAIIGKLTEEFFAGVGSRSEEIQRTVFAVGDEKQSIFSFQGAEPALFERHRTLFKQRAEAAGRAFVSEPLTKSRRSAPEILAFVDRVFANPAAREGLTSARKRISHSAHRATAKGLIEFWPSIKAPKTPEPDPMREVDTPSEISAVVQLAERLAARIAEWIARRVRLPGHVEPIRPGDIMILLPRREPFGSQIIRSLKERNIAVAGSDRMSLTEQIAVMDLIALGRFALGSTDDLTLATVLRSPLCDLPEETLFALCREREGALWRALRDRHQESPALRSAYSFLAESRNRADFSPPYEFYAHALITRGMRRNLLARLGAEASDSIDEFLSLALAFEETNTPSLESFLHWIEQGGDEVKRDMERGRNEVRVMTVHGAKGLEADIVILPDTTTLPLKPAQTRNLVYTDNAVFFPVSDEIVPAGVNAVKEAAYQETLKEHRRLLYVALTRAKDRLYICGFENKNRVKEGSWYDLAKPAAEALGVPVGTGEGAIHVVGDGTEQFGFDIEKAMPKPAIPAWAFCDAPAEPKLPRMLRPSDVSDVLDPSVFSPLGKGTERFRRGLLIHALLKVLPDLPAEARDRAARRFLSLRGVGPAEIEALVGETLAIFREPSFASAFGPGSRAEVGITAELPEIGPGARVNGRIDRLAVGEEDVLIVDFKTNRPPPRRAEDVSEIYLAQMTLYRAAAAKIFLGKRVSCALMWTDGPTLMPLPEHLLNERLSQLKTRLSA
jgi:ATP-dependent helicase/nuclease subunit A